MRDDIYIDYERAKELSLNNQYNEAIEIYRELLKKDPDNYLVKFYLGKQLVNKSENLTEAYNLFLDVSKCSNQKFRNFATFELGKLEYKKHHYKKAKDYFFSLLDTESKVHALLEIGKCEAKLGHLDEAEKYYHESLSISKQSKKPAIIGEQGRLEVKRRNFQEAEKYFKKLYSYGEKTSATADYELGKIAIEKGNYQEARNYLLPLLNKMNKYYVLMQLGKLEEKAGNKNKAKDYYKKLLYGNKKSIGIGLLELGMMEFNDENFEEAIEYFEKLKDVDYVSRSHALLNLGRIKARQKRFLEAKNYYLELLTMDKKSQNYGYLELGRLEMHNGNIEEALDYYNNIDEKETEAYVELEYAKIDVFNEDYTAAKERYKKLLKLDNKTRALACHGLINVAIRENNYEDVLYYVNEELKTQVFPIEENQRIRDYAYYKLGLTEDAGYIGPYYFSLLNNHTKEAVINHMNERLDENGEDFGNTSFLDTVDFNELYDESYEKIQEKTSMKVILVDVYIVQLDQFIGYVGNKKTTAVKVATMPNSKDIIAIYPYPDDLCKIKKDIIK